MEPRNSPCKEHVVAVDGAVLRKAIEKGLDVIGSSGLSYLFYDLESQGIILERGRLCSLKEVCEALESVFGREATVMMMERICKKLGRI